MFQGTIPAPMRSIVAEGVAGWRSVDDIFIGCSGNFTVERVLEASGKRLHGNDITIYSSTLGLFLSGQPFRLELSEEGVGRFGWLVPWMETPADQVATMLLCTRLFQGLNNSNVYYERMRAAYRDQWSKLHEKTKEKVERVTLRLSSFHVGDVVDWMGGVPADENAGVVVFPPFFAGDYENMFSKLDRMFEWDRPHYPELDAERRAMLLDRVMRRDHWLYGTHERQAESMDRWLIGRVQTTNRGVPIYIYGTAARKRMVAPAQPIEPVMIPRVGELASDTDDIGARLSLSVLSGGQFSALRSQYMNAHIRPGQPTQAVAVCCDGRLVGAFAWLLGPTQANWENYLPGPHAYLLSDFPVANTRWSRLAKLVLYAALSKEAHALVERSVSHRLRSCVTTAYSNNPASMKYRGLFKALKRTEASEKDRLDGIHRFQIEYGSAMGRWTLAEGLEEWKRKHGGHLATVGAGVLHTVQDG